MTQEAGGIPQRRCKREGCGHPRHAHRINGDGTCFTKTVTHTPSRTETACECAGYLG